MHKREQLLAKINILLLAIHQYKNTEQVDSLVTVIEKELNTMLFILNEYEHNLN
jgi:hypothetical protein